jgi:hypothetical protein
VKRVQLVIRGSSLILAAKITSTLHQWIIF